MGFRCFPIFMRLFSFPRNFVRFCRFQDPSRPPFHPPCTSLPFYFQLSVNSFETPEHPYYIVRIGAIQIVRSLKFSDFVPPLPPMFVIVRFDYAPSPSGRTYYLNHPIVHLMNEISSICPYLFLHDITGGSKNLPVFEPLKQA